MVDEAVHEVLHDLLLFPGFCDSVPGFSDLLKEDRDKLMKRSYYDMWTVRFFVTFFLF